MKKKKVEQEVQITEKPEGYIFGRPTKYKEEYCQMLVDHMNGGLSFESFAGLIGTSRSIIYDWIKAHPEFLDAKRIGEDRCRIFWEKIGLAGTLGKIPGFNATTFIFNMKNRFRWRDRLEDEPGDTQFIQNNLNVQTNIIPLEKAKTIDEMFSEAIPDPETEYINSFAQNLTPQQRGLLVKKKKEE